MQILEEIFESSRFFEEK